MSRGRKNFIVYNCKGDILRAGQCTEADFGLQAGKDELVVEGKANDITQRIVDGKVANKTPEEIKAGKPPEPMLYEQQKAIITNEQYQDILNRLTKLER